MESGPSEELSWYRVVLVESYSHGESPGWE